MKEIFENWRRFTKSDPLSKENIKKGLEDLLKEETRDTYGSEVSDAAATSRRKGMKDLGLAEKKKKKKKGKKKAKVKKASDRCTRIAKRKYDVWPSAYASGAVVKCRQGKIWKGLKEEQEKGLEIKIRKALRDEGGAAGMDALVKHTDASEKEIKDAIEDMDDVGRHEDGDYILDDGEDVNIVEGKKKAGTESSKESSLRDWFGRKGAPGKKGGWVDCNTCRKDKKSGRTKCKPCGRQKGEKRSKYPACRPTPGACKERGKGKSWGKKSKKRKE